MKFLAGLTLAALTAFTGAACADEAPTRLAQALFQEGVHFERLPQAQPTSSPAGTVEVTEFFMYSCPHCFSFEPHVENWLEKKPANVNFVRVPASFNRVAQLHAQAYYAAEALGVLEDVHGEFFREFHVRKNRLMTEKALTAFFTDQGVDKAAFEKAMASFPVDAKLKKSATMAQRYRLQSVPSVYVNGKYRTDATMAGSYPNLLRVIDYLVAIEGASETEDASASVSAPASSDGQG
ncbi:MAG: thiol:disulfide interchange protein DsbA/DsbL [Pseudomonadota bacterium]